MSDMGAAPNSGGKGRLAAVIAVVLAIAAGIYLITQGRVTPSQGALDAVVPPEASIPQNDVALNSAPAAPVVANEVNPVTEVPLDDGPVVDDPVVEDPIVGDAAESVADENTARDENTLDQDVAVVVPEITPEPEIETPEASIEENTVPVIAAEAPSVDEVRLAADGVAIIAGRAAPGSTVSVMVDGEEVASGVADANGAFAAIGFVTPSDAARIMTLQSTQGETVTASLEEIILAPLPAPVQIAQAPASVAETETPAATSEVRDETQEAPAETTDVATSDVPVVTADAGTQGTVASSVENLANGSEAVVQEEIASAEALTDPAQPVEEVETPAESTPQEDVAQAETETQEEVAQAEATTTSEPSQQIALLKSTEEGVELLQPKLAPTQTVALDTIGYSEAGEVQLSGRANPDAAEVRVYLNNRSVASLPVDEAGTWRGGVPDIAAGVYTLRVDEVASDGRVISRVETPFKREEPAVLVAATADQSGPVRAITVQAGDTLWAIARDRYGEGLLFVKVFEANRAAIRDADLIYPGQVFDLPAE